MSLRFKVKKKIEMNTIYSFIFRLGQIVCLPIELSENPILLLLNKGRAVSWNKKGIKYSTSWNKIPAPLFVYLGRNIHTMKTKEDYILNNMRNIRKQKGIKSENLAKQIGISQSEYSKIENGQRENYYEYLPRIAQAMAVDFHELVDNPSLTQNNYGNISDQGMGNVQNASTNTQELYEKLITSLRSTINEKDERIKTEVEKKN